MGGCALLLQVEAPMNLDTSMGRHRAINTVHRCATFASPDPEPQRIVLAAQDWIRMAAAYSGDRFAEADGRSAMTVAAEDQGGFQHTIFSVIHGGATGEHRAEGYRLVPPAMFDGVTADFIDWRDPATVEARRRGDATGLLVRVKGKLLVCAKAVHFVRDLPTVQPMPLKEAKDYDIAARSMGWRAMAFSGADICWRTLKGHPVVIYQHPMQARSVSMLFWRSQTGIQEYCLPNALDASMFTDPVDAAAPQRMVKEDPIQLGLF